MHAAVDTYGSYAFGFLHAGKRAECAAVLIHSDVLPFHASQGLKVGAILTDNAGVLRNGQLSLRDVPGAQRHRAPAHEGQNAPNQRLH